MKITKGSRERLIYDPRYVIAEFWSKSGGQPDTFEMDNNIMLAIAKISNYYNCKLYITSTRRSPEYNAEQPGASKNSLHISGKAIDWAFPPNITVFVGGRPQIAMEHYRENIRTKGDLYQQLRAIGVGEFILYEDFNHIAIQVKEELIDKVGSKDFIPLESDTKYNLEAQRKIAAVKDYYEYHHLNKSLYTVEIFFSDVNCPAKAMYTKDFLNYKDLNGYSNLDKIWSIYDSEQKAKFSTDYKNLTDEINTTTSAGRKAIAIKERNAVKPVYNESYDYDLNVGTWLAIPLNKANLEVISVIGQDLFLEQQDLLAFQDQEYLALIADPSYIRIQNVDSSDSTNSINYLHLSLNCWIYIRALDKILDLSPFIQNVDTVCGQTGGNFTITLNDLKSIEDLYGKQNEIFSYFQKVTGQKFNMSFFHKYIQQNDIVWIRFEKLEIDKDNVQDLFIDKSELPGKVYDLMGLVGLCSESYSAQSNMSQINISGEDLSKLLTEDGAYFFPLALVNGGKDFFANINPADTVFKRLYGSGEFKSIFTAVYRSIRDSLGFIFNQLTNVGILPEDVDLFSAYRDSYNRSSGKKEDRITKTMVYDEETEKLVPQDANGIWQIIKLIIDNQLDSRRMQNGELSNPEGTLITLIQRICQDPFVEFWGDTMGDQFVFMARQPILTKTQIQDFFKNEDYITITAETISDLNLNWEERYYTWYQIQPLEGLYGSGQFIAGTTMPIVYFEEYAQRFGMHKKMVMDNYITSSIFNGDQEKTNIDLYRKSLANDMKFLVESNSILPFTRKGNIIIQGGDRRIKKNTWIYCEPTNEIFFVKTVTNSGNFGANISRKTTLSVERGMIKDYALNDVPVVINAKEVAINYFNIVNVDVIAESLQTKLVDDKVTISDSGVNQQLINKEVFDFFYKRQQFTKQVDEKWMERQNDQQLV